MSVVDFDWFAVEAEKDTRCEVVPQAIASAKGAQPAWAESPLSQRLKIIRRVRALIAEEAVSLAETASIIRQRPTAEILTAEVLPLADACRFLERSSERILRRQRIGRSGRPLWLRGVKTEIFRDPHGVVLVIGASNYPILLPAVQTLQALVAGNAVLIKPGDGGGVAAAAFTNILSRAGLPKDLLHVLPEPPSAAQSAIAWGVDKVVFTGSAMTGGVVLVQCAETITPATVELSGCDAMMVRADADLDLVVRAIQFGLRLNHGATCVAPRRVFVHCTLASALAEKLRGMPVESYSIRDPHLSECVTDALLDGAVLVRGGIEANGQRVSVPLVLSSVRASMQIACEDIFQPVLSLIAVRDDAQAAELCMQCPYSLGATIFSRNEAAARTLAAHIKAGVVTINDLIVPTADPRLPFSGRRRSGFGTTRGAEGLLEMTMPKVVSVRRGSSYQHFDVEQPGDAQMFASYIAAAHGCGGRRRLAALFQMIQLVRKRSRT